MTDAEINRCRHRWPDYWQTDCEHCPDRARCDELLREEWLRHLSLEPPEEVGSGDC
jgi:hypothetical protein